MKYGYDFTWRRSGRKLRVSGGWFDTKDESDESFLRALVMIGYTVPLWWDVTRWGERRPSVLANTHPASNSQS